MEVKDIPVKDGVKQFDAVDMGDVVEEIEYRDGYVWGKKSRLKRVDFGAEMGAAVGAVIHDEMGEFGGSATV